MRVKLHEATLPIELSNGNTGRGHKWFSSAKARNELALALIEHQRQPFDVPTVVEVVRILGPGQRLWDFSSGLRGNYKEIEDALVELGWWHDDGPKWIRRVTFDQDAGQREMGPATLIRVWDGPPRDLEGELARLHRKASHGCYDFTCPECDEVKHDKNGN